MKRLRFPTFNRLLVLVFPLMAMSLAACGQKSYDKIIDFSPKTGPLCSQVTITGTLNWDGTATGGNGRLAGVWFGGVQATDAAMNTKAGTIKATVPAGAPMSSPVRAKTNTEAPLFGLIWSIIGADTTLPTPFTVDTKNNPATPTVDRLAATPAKIIEGGSATLVWATTNASKISLSNVGDVTGTTSWVVKPTVTTTYDLTASNACLSQTKAVVVTVIPATVTVTPSPILIERNKTGMVTATIPNDGVTAFAISCSSTVANLTCVAPPTVPAGTNSAPLQISVPPTAPLGATPVTITATSLGSPTVKASGTVMVDVGRISGPFAAVKATVGTAATAAPNATGTIGQCGVTLASGGQPNTWNAAIECNGHTIHETYSAFGAVTQAPGLVASLGGIGGAPASNPNLAVVFSDQEHNDATYDPKNVSFTTVPLPAETPVKTFTMAQIEYHGMDNPPVLGQAQFLASPDSSLAVLVGSNFTQNGTTATPPFLWSLVDLNTGLTLKTLTFSCSGPAPPTCYNQVTATLVTAANQQSVNISVAGNTAVSVPLP